MYVNIVEGAKSVNRIPLHLSVQYVKENSMPEPNCCTLRNLKRCFVHMNSKKTIFLCGLKHSDTNSMRPQLPIWHRKNLASCWRNFFLLKKLFLVEETFFLLKMNMVIIILVGLSILLPISAIILLIKADVINIQCIGSCICQCRALCLLLPLIFKYLVCRSQNNDSTEVYSDCTEVWVKQAISI